MARITVEDCLKRIDNRFKLVNAAAHRVRQIREGSEYLVVSPKNEDIVVALREIAAGRVLMQDETAEPEQIEAAEAAAEDEGVEEAEVEETETEETEDKEEDTDKTD